MSASVVGIHQRCWWYPLVFASWVDSRVKVGKRAMDKRQRAAGRLEIGGLGAGGETIKALTSRCVRGVLRIRIGKQGGCRACF